MALILAVRVKKVHIPVSMEETLALVMGQILIVQSFSK